MPKIKEHNEEAEAARHKGSQAYDALWQYQRDEEDQGRAKDRADARRQQLLVLRIPLPPSLEGNLWYV